MWREIFEMIRSRRGQGATEYLLILATATVVVIAVLAMVNGMRAAVPTTVSINGTNMTLVQAVKSQFANMTNITVP